MKFKKEDVVVVNIKKGESKKGKELHFVKIADPTTYENEQFLLNSDTNPALFSSGDIVNVVLNIENGFTTASLINAE